LTYRLIVRIWDTIDREQNGANPAYTEATRDFTYNYDAAVSPVTGLSATADPVLPAMNLAWSRAAQPDQWAILRDGIMIDQKNGSDLFVSGTAYAYSDKTMTGREQHTWSVLALVNSRQSASNPTVTGTVPVAFPWLMRADGTDACCFLNPKRDMAYLSNQELHALASDAPPVLITQSLGGYAGHVEGLMTDNIITGVTARQMRDRMRRLRNDPGVILNLFLTDETLQVAVYNINVSPDSTPSAVSYWASFDYVQAVY
jgi:hypothetical protein